MPNSLVTRIIQFVQESNPDLWAYAMRQMEVQAANQRFLAVVLFLISIAGAVAVTHQFISHKGEEDWFLNDELASLIVTVGITVSVVLFSFSLAIFFSANQLITDYNALLWILRNFQ